MCVNWLYIFKFDIMHNDLFLQDGIPLNSLHCLITVLTEMAAEQMFDSQLAFLQCVVCNVHLPSWHGGHDMCCCKRLLRGGH